MLLLPFFVFALGACDGAKRNPEDPGADFPNTPQNISYKKVQGFQNTQFPMTDGPAQAALLRSAKAPAASFRKQIKETDVYLWDVYFPVSTPSTEFILKSITLSAGKGIRGVPENTFNLSLTTKLNSTIVSGPTQISCTDQRACTVNFTSDITIVPGDLVSFSLSFNSFSSTDTDENGIKEMTAFYDGDSDTLNYLVDQNHQLNGFSTSAFAYSLNAQTTRYWKTFDTCLSSSDKVRLRMDVIGVKELLNGQVYSDEVLKNTMFQLSWEGGYMIGRLGAQSYQNFQFSDFHFYNYRMQCLYGILYTDALSDPGFDEVILPFEEP